MPPMDLLANPDNMLGVSGRLSRYESSFRGTMAPEEDDYVDRQRIPSASLRDCRNPHDDKYEDDEYDDEYDDDNRYAPPEEHDPDGFHENNYGNRSDGEGSAIMDEEYDDEPYDNYQSLRDNSRRDSMGSMSRHRAEPLVQNLESADIDDEKNIESRKRLQAILAFSMIVLVSVGTATFILIAPALASLPTEDTTATVLSSLIMTASDGSVPPAHDDLYLICSPANRTKKAWLKRCREACVPSECCYDINPGDDTCLKRSYHDCVGYMPYCDDFYLYNYPVFTPQLPKEESVEEVVPVDKTIVEPPANLGHVCSSMNLAESWGKDECLRPCRHGACCFPELLGVLGMLDPELANLESCREENEGTCNLYEPCRNLQSLIEMLLGNNGASDGASVATGKALAESDFYLPTPRDISSVCSPMSIQTAEGFTDCDTLCYPGFCCTKKGTQSCLTDHFRSCKDYAPCQILLTGGNPAAACADLTTPEGLRECEFVCKPAECCFVEDESVNCLTDVTKGWCELFEVCKTLVELKTASATKTAGATPALPRGAGDKRVDKTLADNALESNPIHHPVNDDCSVESVETNGGFQKCQETCMERICCFVNESWNCRADMRKWCDEYSACAILGKYKFEEMGG